jgi:predicted membrane metal-binding protein
MNNPLILTINIIVSSLKDWSQFFQTQISGFKALSLEQSNLLIGGQLSNLMFGLIFGAQNSLNSTLYHSFKIMGMLHIWSASGFNVTLFSKAISFLLDIGSYCTYFLRTILLLLSALFFWYMSGQGPSMQRAVLMTGLSLLVRRLCFKQLKPLRSLFFVILIIILIDFSLVDSLSLRFSAAATAGIILLSPAFSSLGERWLSLSRSNKKKMNQDGLLLRLSKSLLSYFFRNLALFFSVQIALLPLISSTWGEIGLLSVITNSLLSGALPILVTLGLIWFSWCSAGIIWASTLAKITVQFVNFNKFSQVFGLLATLPLNFFLKIGHYFTQLDVGSVAIPEFNTVQIGLWYLGWGTVGWWWQKRQTKQKINPLAIRLFAK